MFAHDAVQQFRLLRHLFSPISFVRGLWLRLHDDSWRLRFRWLDFGLRFLAKIFQKELHTSIDIVDMYTMMGKTN